MIYTCNLNSLKIEFLIDHISLKISLIDVGFWFILTSKLLKTLSCCVNKIKLIKKNNFTIFLSFKIKL